MKRKPVLIGIGIALSLILIATTGIALRAKVRAERDRDVAVANAVAAQTEQVRIEQDGRAAILRLQFQHEADSVARVALERSSPALKAMNDSLGVVVTALTDLRIVFDAQMREFDQALVEMADAVTPQGDTVRIAAFVEEGPPVEGEIVVEVPKNPNAPIMLTTVLRPSVWDATLQLGCTENHVASFALDTPAWVRATIELGVVDQDVCLPLPEISFAADLFRIDASKLVWAGAGGILALLLVGALGK
ncbi:hypothetical protein LCGC14_1258200 [marine sediment metagenome]|uniref:Uncharacterized protein n=1 Tax=marine sediment metagenome TaxID=412755 RepID=A0A0F9L1F6_9ZZZZ